MKNPINGLNKVFDSRIRLGVMSILVGMRKLTLMT